jgi:hypothetical protein
VSRGGKRIGSKKFSIGLSAAPAAPAGPDRASAEKKLKALEQAHAAGILSEEEYAAKKAALEAELKPRIDAATQKKLDALDAALAAGILSRDEYNAKKSRLLGGAAPAAPAPTAQPPRPGQTHELPNGVSFWYPKGWTLAKRDALLQLTPPDAQATAEGPTEFYLIGTDDFSGQNVTPEDPRLLQYLDQQVKSLSPALAHMGKTTFQDVRGGKGCVNNWKATTPKGEVHARAYTALLGNDAVILIAMGFKELLAKREKSLEAMFTSMGKGRAAPPAGTQATPAPGATPPAPTAKDPAGPAAAQVAMPAGRKGKTYRHAIGFNFWYPADWTVKVMPEFLQLIPPNPGTSPAGPTEIYFVVGESVADDGITRADDPRIATYLDQQVAALSPTLKRTDPPKSIKISTGTGTVLNWAGRTESGEVLARAYVSIIKQSGVALMALCLKDRLEARDADLRRMFASFSFGAPRRDARLAGTWTYLTTQSMTNWSPFETSYSRAQLAADTSGSLTLKTDGTWQRIRKHQMIAGAGGVWLESNERKVEQGQWFADQGALSLIQKGDIWEEYTYQLKPSGAGMRLLLISGGKGELWSRGE